MMNATLLLIWSVPAPGYCYIIVLQYEKEWGSEDQMDGLVGIEAGHEINLTIMGVASKPIVFPSRGDDGSHSTALTHHIRESEKAKQLHREAG
jgi:hypothetical protein